MGPNRTEVPEFPVNFINLFTKKLTRKKETFTFIPDNKKYSFQNNISGAFKFESISACRVQFPIQYVAFNFE